MPVPSLRRVPPEDRLRLDDQRRYAELHNEAATSAPIINLKTARSLGLTISRSLLLRADQVIE